MIQSRFLLKSILLGGVALLLLFPTTAISQVKRPNIIHIFADDLGWGSVGYNNPNTHIETPNIDSLAMSGMRFNRSYASTVCSPSRANLLTGFHNGHADNDRNGNIGAGLRGQDVTVGEVLSAAGYRTSIVGKWGWGATGNRDLNGSDPEPSINDAESLPAMQGYDSFYGYLNHGAAHDYYYSYLWQSNGLQGQTTFIENSGGANNSPEYIHDLVSVRSEELIRDFALNEDQPFYLQINYTIPHFDLEQILTTPSLLNLAGQEIFPAGVAQYANTNLPNKEQRHAAMISRMDASIGAVAARLADPNADGDNSDSILENTIIFFTSDNGTTPEDGLGGASVESEAISGGLRGGKRDLYEGGIRMPAFAHWPGTIAAGSTTDLVNDLADFQATAADLAGTKSRVGTDGVSILPTLLNQPGQQLRNHLFFESAESSNLGYASADWTLIGQEHKLIRFDNGNYELYQISTDAGESNPLNLQLPDNAAIRDQFEAIALAEGAGQPDAYAVQFREWIGTGEERFNDPANWSVTDEPGNVEVGALNETWSAVCKNVSNEPGVALITSSIDLLGLELGGVDATQTLRLARGCRLGARNEFRVEALGALQLLGADIETARALMIAPAGELLGAGSISGDLNNRGKLAPGIAVDEIEIPETGQFKFTVDFSAIDDRAEKDNFYTPLNGSIPQASIVADYGVSTGSALVDRGFNDFPAEFNVRDWSTGGQVTNAIAGNNYFSLRVDPAPGLSVELVNAGFNFWRNGGNSPVSYGILSNLDGFDANSILGQVTSSNTDPVRLDANGTAAATTDEALEVRLYGWNANSTSGHTHVTGADLEMRFVESPLDDLSPFETLGINGNFSQFESGMLVMEAASLTEHDQLDVSGVASLAGMLQLNLANDFFPAAGQQVALLNANQIVGEFEQVEVVADGKLIDFEVSYDGGSVVVEFGDSFLLGDINRDGNVDLLDIGPFVQLLNNAGYQLEADINGDGALNLLDVSGFVELLSS